MRERSLHDADPSARLRGAIEARGKDGRPSDQPGHATWESWLLRKAIAAIAGLPVLGALYLAPLARRPATLRAALAVVTVALLSAAAAGTATAPVSGHVTPSVDPAASVRMAGPLVTDFRVHRSITFDFSKPMDEASVAAALTVDPYAQLDLSWSADGRHLTVSPQGSWAPSQIYALRVGTTARDRTGRSIATPVGATFLTRGRPSVTLALTKVTDGSGLLDTGVDIVFSEAVNQDTVRQAFTVSPAVDGRIVSVSDVPNQPPTFHHFRWIPAEPLTQGTDYTFSLNNSVADADGVTMLEPATLAMSTLTRPAVVRYRPSDGTKNVDRSQVISVRFTMAMQPQATESAFHVSGLADSAGRFAWYEGDTVLAWTPRSPLAYGKTYTVTIDGTAMSAAGLQMGTSASDGATTFKFTVASAPKPVVQVRTTTSKPKPVSKPSVSPTTSSPWYAVELYYLNLLNCTHTGGWVHSDGTCTGRGSNGLAPLKLSSGISNCATRPWAKYLAVNDLLEHYGGSPYTGPGDRLRNCGYGSYAWAENLGQWSGDPYQGAIKVVLFFQSEKSYNGGHWVNLMNGNYHSVGIGIWISGGRAVYNSDFYGG